VAVGLYLCTFLTTPLGEEQSASRSDFFTPWRKSLRYPLY
jgi:hypothetical protein